MKTGKLFAGRNTIFQALRWFLGLFILCLALTAQAQDFESTKQAAEKGDAQAQYSLGGMYYNGQGVAKDYAEAAKWWRASAEQGNAEAQNDLGAIYANGQGVERNLAEAKKWWSKAAAQGQAGAKDSLEGLKAMGK